MTKSPAFQFYPDDFRGSGKVGTMTTEEIGAYVLLLCLDWNETGFVFDEEELSRWCLLTRAKFRKAWVRVSRCFVDKDGRLFNPRLEAERTKQAEWREKSRKGGVASGEARAKGGSTTLPTTLATNDEPPAQPNGNTPFPSPTPVTATTPVATAPGRKAKAVRPPAPWMGRMASAWCFGDLPPGSATLLQPVVSAVGVEETAARLSEYCAAVESRYASVRDFVSKHATYGERLAVDPATGTLNATGMQALGLGGRR